MKKKDAEKKAHHNKLEQKRRGQMKDNFFLLKDVISTFEEENIRPTRARITEEAVKYINSQLAIIDAYNENIDSLKDQNAQLEESIRLLEKAEETGNYKEAFNFINRNLESKDMSENSETEEKPIIRKNLGTQSCVSYRKKQKPRSCVSYRKKRKPLSDASNKSKKKKSKNSRSLNEYSWDNISPVQTVPSDVQTVPSDVQTLSFYDILPSYIDNLLENLPSYLDDLPSNVDNLPSYLDDLPSNVDNLPSYLDDLPSNVDNLPLYVDNLPLYVDNQFSFADKACSDLTNQSNNYNRELFELYITDIKEEPY